MTAQRPRITFDVEMNEDGSPGELCLYFNELGRVALINLIQGLTPQWEHEHLDGRSYSTDEVCLDEVAYRETAQVVSSAKFLLRLDQWDETHFPNVMNGQPSRPVDK
jgi:hypothetical protein